MRYMDDITIVTSDELADLAFLTIEESLEEAGMLLNVDKCTAWTSNGVTPKDPMTKQLWEQARDHRGFIVCGFPATFENPVKEAATPATIGDEEFIRDFLENRKEALMDTLRKCVEAATMATATLPVVHSYNCILRT
jgi:hypothetical protein